MISLNQEEKDMSKFMFCINCSGKVLPNHRFCASCGTKQDFRFLDTEKDQTPASRLREIDFKDLFQKMESTLKKPRFQKRTLKYTLGDSRPLIIKMTKMRNFIGSSSRSYFMQG
jgi:ribosomal protein L32